MAQDKLGGQAVIASRLPSLAIETQVQRRQRWKLWRRFERNQLAVVGFVVVLLTVLMALCAPLLPLDDPNAVNPLLHLAPAGTAGHLLGTDELGRDVLSRIVWGSRSSITAGVVAAFISLVPGVVLGVAAGFYTGKVDGLIMRITDVVMAFPPIVLALGVVAMLGPGLFNAMLAVGVVGYPLYARLVRASVLSIREREFVEAARSAGGKGFRIMVRHILPNVWAPVIVTASLDVGRKIIATSALSFLGLGSQPPNADWGSMLATGRNVIMQAPHVTTFPGLAIFALVLGLNLLGDGLRDALDPRLIS